MICYISSLQLEVAQQEQDGMRGDTFARHPFLLPFSGDKLRGFTTLLFGDCSHGHEDSARIRVRDHHPAVHAAPGCHQRRHQQSDDCGSAHHRNDPHPRPARLSRVCWRRNHAPEHPRSPGQSASRTRRGEVSPPHHHDQRRRGRSRHHGRREARSPLDARRRSPVPWGDPHRSPDGSGRQP